jgi:hypothetical protein
MRYPGDTPEITIAEAESAVNLATEVQGAILKALEDRELHIGGGDKP